MRSITVSLGERSYEIRIGISPPLGISLANETGISALVVSDTNVDPLYGAGVESRLAGSGVATTRIVVPAGEKSKSLDCARVVYDAALKAGLDRRSVIVALGGGMVGDLAGFAAGTFLRGVRLVQIPTTLLAMVDSSVGGKTAVNLPQGKNMIGVFHQPVEVCSDLTVLESLPEREYVSGLAEVVKYGIIWDASLFSRIEEKAEAIMKRDRDVLEDIVARCCEIKAEIVAVDERDSGVRAVLNFGHTLGHAIEQMGGYADILHGEAVSAGMAYAAILSEQLKGFPRDDAERILVLLRRLGLPVKAGGAGRLPSWKETRVAMSTDKKAVGRSPRFVLAERMGSVVYGCEAAEDVLESAFDVLMRG